MSNHDTEKFETPEPKKTWRDRRVGIVALAASTVAALVIGGTVGAVSGAAVGYGVGHHDHPDRPALVQRQGQPQLVPPNGELPPGVTQEQEEGSQS